MNQEEKFFTTEFYRLAYAKGERLRIRQFGPISNIDIEIKPITVIIGSTGSGKSTIIKLLHIFRQLILNSDLTTEKFKIILIDKFQLVEPVQNTYIKYELGDFYIEYTEGVLKTNFSSNFRTEWQDLQDFSTKEFEETSKIPSLINSLFLDAAKHIYKPIYIPAERLFTSTHASYLAAFQLSEIPISDYMLQFIKNIQIAKRLVRKMSLPFLKATYYFKNGIDIIEHDKDKSTISLDFASSGFQAIIPVLLVFEYFSKRKDPFSHVFVVEEPELNLYPSVQKHIIEEMVSKTIKWNSRLVIATHSPYILTALNNLIIAKTIIKEHPESIEAVNKEVPPQYQVDFQDVMAYYVNDGTAKSIMNEEYSMIDANALDDVSNELGHTYDKLLNLLYP